MALQGKSAMKPVRISPQTYRIGDFVCFATARDGWRLGEPVHQDDPLAGLVAGSVSHHRTLRAAVSYMRTRERVRQSLSIPASSNDHERDAHPIPAPARTAAGADRDPRTGYRPGRLVTRGNTRRPPRLGGGARRSAGRQVGNAAVAVRLAAGNVDAGPARALNLLALDLLELLASASANPFTPDQWAARLAADKARWAREDAGLEPSARELTAPARRAIMDSIRRRMGHLNDMQWAVGLPGTTVLPAEPRTRRQWRMDETQEHLDRFCGDAWYDGGPL